MTLAVSSCGKLASRQALAFTSAYQKGNEFTKGPQFGAPFADLHCRKRRTRPGLVACNDGASNSNLQ